MHFLRLMQEKIIFIVHRWGINYCLLEVQVLKIKYSHGCHLVDYLAPLYLIKVRIDTGQMTGFP